MLDYEFEKIEKKWQNYWDNNKTFKVIFSNKKPKFYSLDMFPYPSGSGLHVGHPLGYIASDIISRYKKNKGYNVLHTMGFDAFGLPTEQHSIETGNHPYITTDINIKRYKSQLKKIGLSFDWSREFKTCDPGYYKWTQWLFIKLFDSWYNFDKNKAESIKKLIFFFKKNGNKNLNAACDKGVSIFTAESWEKKNKKDKERILLKYRLAFLKHESVNWCPGLRTVLSNDEVVNGFSKRGNHPVVIRKMKQWMIRITAYKDRLLNDLNNLDWSKSIKKVQKNWVGKLLGFNVLLKLNKISGNVNIFSKFIYKIHKISHIIIFNKSIQNNIYLKNERNIKIYLLKYNNIIIKNDIYFNNINGIFTKIYTLNPITKNKIPIWLSNYILKYKVNNYLSFPFYNNYDYIFLKYFNINIYKKSKRKYSFLINENYRIFKKNIEDILKLKSVKRKTKYLIHDTVFSRQRYWGEPFPIYYKNKIANKLSNANLPLILPKLDLYKFNKKNSNFLKFLKIWKKDNYFLESNTMPSFAGSSWYFFRYMDSFNKKIFVEKEKQKYWSIVDLYIGGSEHSTGHLIYSRFFTKFLYDLNFINIDEPFKKLVNQGMIQYKSMFIYRIEKTNILISYKIKNIFNAIKLNIDINLVENNNLNFTSLKKKKFEFKGSKFILYNNQYLCNSSIEKMSKSKYNIINPDNVIKEYGSDTFRIYSMFLGPIEQNKIWNTNNISGVFKFVKRLWNLFHSNDGNFYISLEDPDKNEEVLINKMIKTFQENINKHYFNTIISAFMIFTNTVIKLKCYKKKILKKFIILVSSFAPHISEEIWEKMGYNYSIVKSKFPTIEKKYLKLSKFVYSIQINGKFKLNFEVQKNHQISMIKKKVLLSDKIKKLTKGKNIKKFIFIKNKIINLVL